MPTPTEQTCLNQARAAIISRYGSINAGCAALGVSRWGIRHAVMGRCPGVLKKLRAAGVFDASKEFALQALDSVAVNSWGGETTGICYAVNARSFTGSLFEQITPFGRFPNPCGLQIVDEKTCGDMVAAFNALKAREGSAFKGLCLYLGHPDQDPGYYKDSRPLGSINELEVRDGLWCRVAMNALGIKNRKEKRYCYPSAVWRFKRGAGGVIFPFELVSVGMTNAPIIPTVRSWTAAYLQSKQDAGHASPTDEKTLTELLDRLPAMLIKQADNGPTYEEQNKALGTKLADAEKTAREHPDEAVGERATAQANDIRDQLNAIAYYQQATSTLASISADNAKAQEEGATALIDLRAHVDALELRVQAAELKARTLKDFTIPTDTATQQGDEAHAKAKADFDAREAKRIGRETAPQEVIDDPIAKPDAKAQAKALIDAIEAEGKQDQLSNAGALGLSTIDIANLKKALGIDTAKASDVVRDQTNKDNAKGTGSDALQLITQLGPTRQQAQEASAAVHELDKGQAQGAVELEEVLNRLVNTTKDVNASQRDIFQKVFSSLKNLEDELELHGRSIKSLSNGGGYQ